MAAYEAMFIFKPDLKEEEQKALVDDLENILKENQSEIVNSQVFGRRQLAYEINKHKEGLYYLMDFSTQAGAVVSKLKRACNINENVLRTLIVKKNSKETKL
ncbi:MAG: 30S ribosomal protein S6 [Candidatus Omnitrophica bacterium]|nr:30S ribosomal protein S6 [Candidatus Omnitrophota bacterium]